MKTPANQKHSQYALLIIGAGINGCGTVRDLCLQGVDCLLIDKGDVCSGANAAPSGLIHGGIKYLETNAFRLVKESAMERNRLLRRTAITMEGLLTPNAIQETAKVVADFLGWKKGRTNIEIELAKVELAKRSVKNVRLA